MLDWLQIYTRFTRMILAVWRLEGNTCNKQHQHSFAEREQKVTEDRGLQQENTLLDQTNGRGELFIIILGKNILTEL